MSVRRIVVHALGGAVCAVVATLSPFALVACTGQEQELGGSPPAASDPGAAPTTWVTDPDPKCPWRKPAEGSACDTRDDHGAPTAPQCSYDRATSCPSICVCGIGGRWSCFHAACGILSADRCFSGEPCSEGVGCTSDTQDCRCGQDLTLRCAPRSIP